MDSLIQRQSAVASTVLYHAKTLYLVVEDQIFDIILPGTIFAFSVVMAGPTLDLPEQKAWDFMLRAPAVAGWLWLLVFQVDIQNQRSEASIIEDTLNKPWRPIPSGRITPTQANRLYIASTIAVFFLSYYLQVLSILVFGLCLGIAYNELGGSDHSGVSRNLLCGIAYACFFTGALKIGLGPGVSMSALSLGWTLFNTLGMLATTIQMQDFRDEAGDRARGRRTIVTQLGRSGAISFTIIVVTFWSLFVPMGFMQSSWKVAGLPLIFGSMLVAMMSRSNRDKCEKMDRRSYNMWTLWLLSFYPLPLVLA